MGKHNIEKFSLTYGILKGIATFWHNWIYYRKVIIIDRDNINLNDHNIFAINHQNALMDAMALICTSKGQQVFLTRSSAFKNKFIARILYIMKMLPVFRIRDGYSSLKQNDEIFNKTIDIIVNKNGLGILPEGNHAGYRRLRDLKKGICRIAFQTEEFMDFKLDIKIVPVGLDYSHYWKFRQVLTVVYGKPIGFTELHDLYREKPQVALNRLREKISEQIKDVMIHIENEEDYEAINELREIVNGKYCGDRTNPKIWRDKELISKLEKSAEENPDLYRGICDKSLKIKHIAKNLNLGYYHLNKPKPTLLWHMIATPGLIILSPVALFGFITNLFFYRIPNLALKSIKDLQFLSSVRFAVSMALGIIIIPVYTALVFIFIS
ncbi:MAG: 1-acyl-sn-glycerol-3-phosphate acyltransferase, partial [Bacteroidales bacterium]|nr:1-acyl-sn-glycerol-3-phosphate acyltransferase [Bacteroidales bacterium]